MTRLSLTIAAAIIALLLPATAVAARHHKCHVLCEHVGQFGGPFIEHAHIWPPKDKVCYPGGLRCVPAP